MRDRDILRRLENQLNLLYAFGRWVSKIIAERLNNGKLDDIGYKVGFINDENPDSVISNEILILQDLPQGSESAFPIATIKTDGRFPIMPVMEISMMTRTYLSAKEHVRFLKVMNLIADEMHIPLIEEK